MDRCTHSTKYTNLQPENKRNSFAEICIFCGIPKSILTEYMIDTNSETLSIENYIGTVLLHGEAKCRCDFNN